MIKLGSLLLNGAPRVAVNFGDDVSPGLLVSGKAAGLDIAEIRIDQFSSYDQDHVLHVVKKFENIPTIATIRLQKEGGSWRGAEEDRLALFQAILPYVDATDVEMTSDIRHAVIRAAHDARKLCVVSHHNFDTTESLQDLTGLVEQAKSEGADIVKIATKVDRREHLQTLARLTLQHANKNVIVIGMGAAGLASRLFLPALGSLITFAYVGKPTAPGQLHYQETFDLLRKMYPSYNQEKINSLRLMEST